MATQLVDHSDGVRNRIEQLVGPQKFKVWFKSSTRLLCSDGILKVGVPNIFIGNWIENHYADAIQQAVREVVGDHAQVTYAIDPELFRSLRKNTLNSQAAFIEKSTERAIREARGARAETLPVRRILKGRLDQFVVGPGNRLAWSVAVSMVENPKGVSGPVFLYSTCGLGKTHLLQGIANALSERTTPARWVYATGEEFTNQFIYALRERKLDAFRHRYREVDVFLIDDMQFIANKKATQEEFLHTFNAIHEAGKRVVLASDAHPKMIGDLSDSLVNRLMSGLLVRIERPDFDTRCQILLRRAAQLGAEVPEPVVQYIADKIQANVRELEGCLVKLIACAALAEKPVTLDIARQALEEHLTQTGKILHVSDIEQSVCTYFGLTIADLHTSRKSRTIALARNVAMFLARKHTDLSLPEIARMMGNKNHTTVLLACRRIQLALDQDAVVTWQSAAGLQSRKLRAIVASQEEQLGR